LDADRLAEQFWRSFFESYLSMLEQFTRICCKQTIACQDVEAMN